jgi:hypothetical protein
VFKFQAVSVDAVVPSVCSGGVFRLLGKSCYPPEKFLAERVASQGMDNTADWNNIDQQVGTLADQIVAKIC